jgi:hypothetical protein
MKTDKTARTAKTIQLDLEPKPEETGEEPFIEAEFPEAPHALERPSLEQRKGEASKPIYLIRYE